jgi:hypothetical protein
MRITVLPETFANTVPMTVTNGMLISKGTTGENLRLATGKFVCPLHLLHNIRYKTSTIAKTDATIEKVDSGFGKPKIGYKVLNNRPRNIKNARLTPTEKRIVSVRPTLFNLKILRIKNPGINER